MKKNDKIIIIFYVFLAISFTVGILYIDSTFDTTTLPNILPEAVSELEIIKETEIEKEQIFLIMTNLENYPNVLPQNIKSIQIVEDIDNEILVEYEVVEAGITSKLLVKHRMYPHYEHIMEVMDGDAKGTKITQKFTDTDSVTTIHTLVELDLKGILSPFGFLPKGNLEHASNTIVTSFIDYSLISENQTKKIDEMKQEMKTLEELDEETKKIIDDLYREILQRPADVEAFEYWGSLLESEKITKIELRKSILKSEEAYGYYLIDAKLYELVYDAFNDVYETSGPYYELGALFFDPRIDTNEFREMSNKNRYLLYTEEITVDEFRLELEQLKENGTDFLVNDLESVQEQFLDWQKRFVDGTDDSCYSCKWGKPYE